MFILNFGDGSIPIIDPNPGELSSFSRGSTSTLLFPPSLRCIPSTPPLRSSPMSVPCSGSSLGTRYNVRGPALGRADTDSKMRRKVLRFSLLSCYSYSSLSSLFLSGFSHSLYMVVNHKPCGRSGACGFSAPIVTRPWPHPR